MKEELIIAEYGSKNFVSKWGEARVRTTYKRLEELRRKDPTAPQKPDYSKAGVSKGLSKLQPKRTTAPAGTAIYKRRRQSQLSAETVQDILTGNAIVKKGILLMLKEESELEQSASTAQPVMNRPASPNSSTNKNLPKNPSGSKIQKWKTDKQTHVLTLLRSDGEEKKLTREQALGLSLEDLQDLLDLPLSRDDDDTDALTFELQFKGQIRELLLRQ
ncbi:hypothetical protein HanIR_Chr04g0174611 [Helianthus annuus]|nr:hypothetical protein HanIR_Chr04g0174611 [Helianthus annuus]